MSDECNPDELDSIDRDILAAIRRRCGFLARRNTTSPAGANRSWQAELSRVERIARSNRDSSTEAAVPAAISRDAEVEIMRHIASVCLQVNQPLSAAFLGPVDSYSHLACLEYFGAGIAAVPVTSIAAVFDAVGRHEADHGIVPIENSTDGRVVDTLSRLLHGDSQIVGEVLVPIHHALLSGSERDQIREIHSKPQALSQCRRYLSDHFPSARLVETTSTAAAAKLASEQPGIAAVASLEAGRRHGLAVIQASIEDNPNNVTRFAVLGNQSPPASDDDKTTLMFQVDHRPGALADVMGIFKSCDLNLTWIESFPQPDSDNEYFFVVEFRGHRDDVHVRRATSTLQTQTKLMQVLGSYPRGRRP